MSMTGITNATITPKDRHMSRLTTPRSASKPFVVCSISTKRYAGSKTSKTSVQRLSPTVRPTSSRDRPHVPNEAPMKRTHRPGPVGPIASTASKTEVRRSFTKPALAPDPGETTRLKKSAPFSRLTSKDRSLSQRAIGSEPTKAVERSKEDKITRGYPAPVRSTQLTTANEALPRPSCVPRGRIPRSPVGATLASKGRQAVIVKALIPRLRNPGIKYSVDIPTTRAGAHAVGVGSSVRNPSVSEHRPGVPSTQNERLTLHDLVVYPHVNWSPPPSPDLSSLPSQSWIIAINVDVKQAKTTTTVCGDETPTSIRDVEKSETPDDSCRSSESASTSPTLSSSSTVVSMLPNPDMCVSGADNTLQIGSLRKEPSVEVSPTECTAKIISRSRNGTTSTDTLAKMIERSQAGSPTKNSDAGSTARMTVRSAIEIARNLFSRSPHVSKSTPKTAALKTIGTDVLRIRKLFVPSLEKDKNASQNAMIQIEIEMLRARKKVAGGRVVNPRLERLGSLSAMATVTKHSTSSPGQA